MPVTPITTSTNPTLLSGGAASVLPTQALNQQDFLKLLVTQMTQQDPMNPQSNIDFSAQMAQFSTLQQTTAMQAGIAQLGAQQQFLQANDLIGRTVTLQNADQSSARGVVSAVQLAGGTPQIVVNGQSYALSQVLAVAPAQTQP